MSTTLPDHDPSSYDDDTEETDRTKQLSWTAPGTYRQHDYLVDIPTNWQSFGLASIQSNTIAAFTTVCFRTASKHSSHSSTLYV